MLLFDQRIRPSKTHRHIQIIVGLYDLLHVAMARDAKDCPSAVPYRARERPVHAADPVPVPELIGILPHHMYDHLIQIKMHAKSRQMPIYVTHIKSDPNPFYLLIVVFTY